MKFLCIECDEQMRFEDRQQPGDGTFAAAFACPRCGRRIAMLANPMETQLVGSLGVKIGGRTLDEQPLELVRSSLQGRDDAFSESQSPEHGPVRPRWSVESQERLARVPNFVRGMVRKIYSDYAVEHGITDITPDVMDRARAELGLEGM
ncbi:MAG TPA: PCP reductase family protein [Gemmatimonadaceae bacterium]|nr:PCP reductase family protein [Gemmatimonadaceae bacterium]